MAGVVAYQPAAFTRVRAREASMMLVAGALATALAVIVAAHGNVAGPAITAIAGGVAVAVPIAVGTLLLRWRANDRLGRLLIVSGFSLAVVSLSASDADLVQTVGRIAEWGVNVGVVYVLLSFPSGRLVSPIDRRLV